MGPFSGVQTDRLSSCAQTQVSIAAGEEVAGDPKPVALLPVHSVIPESLLQALSLLFMLLKRSLDPARSAQLS